MPLSRVNRGAISGFSLVELLVVVSIIALLISLLLPGLSNAREVQRLTGCHGNLRQIWVGINAYANDYREYFPTPDAVGNHTTRMLPGRLTAGSSIATPEVFGLPALMDTQGYMDANPGVWCCPGAPGWIRQAFGSTYNYSVNSVLATKRRDVLIQQNPTTGLLFDNATSTPAVTGVRGPAHTGGTWTVPAGLVWPTTTWSATIPANARITYHRVAGWKPSEAQNANWLYPTGRSKLLYQSWP